ncbi:MAG: glutamine-hydrolyzing carbamoyl-phosphate synthase small subunit [Chloroflexi bacterium]|nr:glutamine-hydrolyzing carbamoyl-phosphate synthase small subunit [Chloroflexota bacterium]
MAILALEDGTIWTGHAFGAVTETVGEVVFNTALSGYQEVLTDPSYHSQMVVMTATQVGNTGVNFEDEESRRPYVAGFIVRELSSVASNWRSQETLDAYLKRGNVPGITGLNTRALTLHLRTHGALRGALSTVPEARPRDLVDKACAWSGLAGRDLAVEVTCTDMHQWREPSRIEWGLAGANGVYRPRVVVYDYGVKQNILRRLHSLGCDVLVVPAKTPLSVADGLGPDGYLLSNGPGDPEGLPYAAQTAAALIERGSCTLGICLGHQLIGLALGGRTYKLKFGHHGANQPVKDVEAGRVRITSQNHNYAVVPESLPSFAIPTEINLNDGTLEGFRLLDRPIWSVQYHPEASPGPHDADEVFQEFVTSVKERVWLRSGQS